MFPRIFGSVASKSKQINENKWGQKLLSDLQMTRRYEGQQASKGQYQDSGGHWQTGTTSSNQQDESQCG